MMNKYIVIVALALTTVAFGQKKEIKKAEKALTASNYSEALEFLNQAEGLLAGADAGLVNQFYLAKSEALLGAGEDVADNKLNMAINALKTAQGRTLNSEEQVRYDRIIGTVKGVFVSKAIEAQNTQNYQKAAQLLADGYKLSATDTSFLYYAAGNLVNGGFFDQALVYYNQLLDMGYTGVRQEYYASSKENGESVLFGSKEERDAAVRFGLYVDSVDSTTASVESDLLQKVTLIYINKGMDDEAVALMKRARAANPEDTNLMRSEADLAYKMGDMVKYSSVMQEVIQTDPNNPELYYNLGVSAMQMGNNEDAKTYYGKALELEPEYAYAQINMASIILQGEGALVEEMNNLGTSRADNLRYDALKEERRGMYQEALPYLEAASVTVPENVEVLRTLMNLYSQLGMNTQYKAAKAKIETMSGN